MRWTLMALGLVAGLVLGCAPAGNRETSPNGIPQAAQAGRRGPGTRAATRAEVSTEGPIEEMYYVGRRIESYAEEQGQLYNEFKETRDSVIRDRNAYILSELWRANLLGNDIRDSLVDDHYRLVLLQYTAYPGAHFVARCYQTFPFPGVWIRFTPTLYINGEIDGAPEGPQSSHSLSVNNSTITSRSGGVVGNGDIIQYKVRLQQVVDNEVVWEKTIWSNRIVAQGLNR